MRVGSAKGEECEWRWRWLKLTEDVEVVGLELLERITKREVERLLVVARIVDGLVLTVRVRAVVRLQMRRKSAQLS